MCTFDADSVAPYYLEIAGKKYDIESHRESDSGECLMELREAAGVLEIQRLLAERKGALASCALKESVAGRPGEPLYGHGDLSVVEARPAAAVVVARKGGTTAKAAGTGR